MPTDKFEWTWEEAFQVHGFNSGDNPQHSDSVGDFLVSLGWHYAIAHTHHNYCISEIWKGDNRDEEWIQFEGHEDNADIRKLLLEDVVAALDKEYPVEGDLRIVVMVDGGIVQEILSDQKCDYLIIDEDCEGFDVDRIKTMTDMAGNSFEAGVTKTEATLNPEAVEHYWKQEGNEPHA